MRLALRPPLAGRDPTHRLEHTAKSCCSSRLETVRSFGTSWRQEDGAREYRVLAIETSCDDTAVAVVTARKSSRNQSFPGNENKQASRWTLRTHYHEKVTANNDAFHGIHPLVALESHRASLAPLVKKGLEAFRKREQEHFRGGETHGAKPLRDHERLDFVAVTRGPGMRSNLSVGLDTAKGIAVAMDLPLIGVHHMQAHALTPRLTTAMGNMVTLEDRCDDTHALREAMAPLEPAFPFLSVLVSGGHTMLLDSTSLNEHHILAESPDVALGQYLDKTARAILPQEMLKAPYARALEQFAFHSKLCENSDDQGDQDDPVLAHRTFKEHIESCQPQYNYRVPCTQEELLERHVSQWGWALTPPLVERNRGQWRRMEYSFAGLLTFVENLIQHNTETHAMTLRERQALAQEVQRVAFEHLASRILLYLTSAAAANWKGDTIVVSGGVAANKFLRHVLRSILDARGFERVKLAFPPVELSTDNAMMIAWAGIEMYDAGWRSSLEIGPIRKWSMDPEALDGGILGAGGWLR